MKNLVLVFDRAGHLPGLRDATNAERLQRLLEESAEQVVWYDPGLRSTLWRRAAAEDAHSAIAEAYEFLIDCWTPGDRIYVFGVGSGGHCAQALTGLLNVVGLRSDLTDWALAAYATPRTERTPADWRRVARLFADLAGELEIGVPVQFLGLWDAVKVPGVRRTTPAPMPNVVAGRHAVAIDGPPGVRLVASERIEEVWFRGAHCDVAGGLGACRPLADIALDWVLDGALRAGVVMHPRHGYSAPMPPVYDALAGSARTLSVRKVPIDAQVHASVEIYVRERAEYWRRLPARVVWADDDWAARSERLLPAAMQLKRAAAPALASVGA